MFHKKYKTWFKKNDESDSNILAKLPAEGWENLKDSGPYIYFDYEVGWCQMKNDFCFEFKFLENEITKDVYGNLDIEA
jgi:CCR4-NOT transcriptional regulation complex NOT5 subunit